MVVLARVAVVVCGDMLGPSVRLTLVLVDGVRVERPSLLLAGVSSGCSVLSGERGIIPLQYSLLPKLILL